MNNPNRPPTNVREPKRKRNDCSRPSKNRGQGAGPLEEDGAYFGYKAIKSGLRDADAGRQKSLRVTPPPKKSDIFNATRWRTKVALLLPSETVRRTRNGRSPRERSCLFGWSLGRDKRPRRARRLGASSPFSGSRRRAGAAGGPSVFFLPIK